MSRHFRLTSSTETEYDTRDFPAPYQPRQFSGTDDYYEGVEEDNSGGRNSARGFYPNSPSHSPHHCQQPLLDPYPVHSSEAFQPYDHVRRPRSASIPFVFDSGHDRPSSLASHRVDRVLVEQDSLNSPPGAYKDENCIREGGQQYYVPHPADSVDSSGRRHRPRARTLEGLFFQPRHSRSQSSRSSSARSQIGDDFEDKCFRPRVSTMPNASADAVCSPGEEQHFYLARNFQTNAKGKVVNCGDRYCEGSRSNTSVCSSSSNKSSLAAAPAGETGPPLRVMMLGGVGVGKSSLVSQFMSSEFVNAYEQSNDEEEVRPVSVMIDDEEYYLCFIDHPICSDLPHHSASADDQATEADAYLVVYSITDASTFRKAEDLLKKLRQRGDIQNRAVILVANKCDLVRSREVSENSGKEVASHHECKYAEISAGLKHNVDELLVGLVTQIKLKSEQQKGDKKEKPNHDRRHSKTSLFLGNRTRLFFDKIFGRGDHVKSKSCDNLQEL